MSPSRRNVFIVVGAVIAGLTLLPVCHLLSTSRIVVPPSPGSMADFVTRSVQPRMAAFLGERIIVENRWDALAGTSLQNVLLATLLLQSDMSLIRPLLTPKAGSPSLELTPMAAVAEAPLVLAVPARSGISHLDGHLGVVRMADRPPLVGTIGTGGFGHLVGLMLSSKAGAPVGHMPHPGTPELVQDRAAGRLSGGFIAPNPALILSEAEAERSRAVAITSTTRYTALPNVPTFAEAGLETANMTDWHAFLARADMPSYTRHHLAASVRHALDDRTVRRQMLALGVQPLIMNTSRFSRKVEAQHRVLEVVVAQGDFGPG